MTSKKCPFKENSFLNFVNIQLEKQITISFSSLSLSSKEYKIAT